MKDFRLFDISDFVMDDDFIRWVNQGNKADEDFWSSWLRQHPHKHMVVAEARRILESMRTEEKVISEEEKEREINRLLLTIREQPHTSEQLEPESHGLVAKMSKKWWYAAAAVFIIVTCGSIYLLQKRNQDPNRFSYALVTPSKRLVESVNTSGKTITLKLPDESIVDLAPDSRIGYENDFDSSTTRDIYLSGEAFFRVTKNPNRPFRVFANEIVTKVLGTSFSVRSFEKDTVIQVTVRTGKVSVYSQAAGDIKETGLTNQLGGIILTPNQELVYKKLKQKFQKNLLENPVEIAPDVIDQKNIAYEEAPLEKVFGQLGKAYGISIVYDNELLKKCTVTADLRNESFYRKLELICIAIGAHYEIIDGQVVIQTNGCE